MTIHGYKEIVQELKKKRERNEKEGHSCTAPMILTAVKRNSALLTCRRIRILPVSTREREKKKEKNKEKLYRHPSNSRTFFLETCRSGCIAFNKLKLEDIPTENSRNLSWIRNKVHLRKKDRKNPRSTTFEFAHFPTFIDIFSFKNCKY